MFSWSDTVNHQRTPLPPLPFCIFPMRTDASLLLWRMSQQPAPETGTTAHTWSRRSHDTASTSQSPFKAHLKLCFVLNKKLWHWLWWTPKSQNPNCSKSQQNTRREERVSAPGFTWNVLKEELAVQSQREQRWSFPTWCPSVWVAGECFGQHTSPSNRCLRSLHPLSGRYKAGLNNLSCRSSGQSHWRRF